MRKTLLTILLMCLPTFAVDKAPRASLVVTVPMVKGSINPLQTYVGTLYYDKQSKLASEFSGVVQSISFREGEHVNEGEVLVRLDSQVLQANIAAKNSAFQAMQADLIRQTRDMERTKALFDRKSISQSSFDQVFYGTQKLQAEVQAVKSELEAMKIQHQKTEIKAPFSGVISSRNVEVGEWVGQGSTIGTLIATDSIEARVNIPARLLTTLNTYKKFAATVDGEDVTLSLKSVIPVADISTRTFPVEMKLLETKGLIEGMRIDVKVPVLKQQEAMLVPRDAVIKRFGQTVVFINRDGFAVMMPVQVVGYKTDEAAISGDGLKEGMKVVTKGNERIFPNMPVMEKAN